MREQQRSTHQRRITVDFLGRLQRCDLGKDRHVVGDDLVDGSLGKRNLLHFQTTRGREVKSKLLRVDERALHNILRTFLKQKSTHRLTFWSASRMTVRRP